MKRAIITLLLATCVSCVAVADGVVELIDGFDVDRRHGRTIDYSVTVSGGAKVSLDPSDGRVRIEVPADAEASVTHGHAAARITEKPLTVRLTLARGTGAFTPIRVGFQDADSSRRQVYPIPTVYRYADTISEDIRRITGADRIKLYFSEHARWPPRPKQGPWSLNFHKSHSLEAVLAISEFINLGHSRNDVAMMTYHILHGGPWRTIDVTPDGQGFFFTGIADLFGLYQDTLSGDVVHAKLSGPQTDVTQDSLSLSVLSTRCPDTQAITILLANRSASSTRLVNLETRRKGYAMTDRWEISADDPNAHNTAEARPLAVKHRSLDGETMPATIKAPPLTVAVVKLMPGEAGVTPGGTVDASE